MGLNLDWIGLDYPVGNPDPPPPNPRHRRAPIRWVGSGIRPSHPRHPRPRRRARPVAPPLWSDRRGPLPCWKSGGEGDEKCTVFRGIRGISGPFERGLVFDFLGRKRCTRHSFEPNVCIVRSPTLSLVSTTRRWFSYCCG